MKYILSYGGGLNSTAMYFYIKEKELPLDLVLFADTGEELPRTYETVRQMKKLVSEEFVTVQSKLGTLYDYYWKVKKVPSFMKRDCTHKFKIRPMRKYLRNRFGKKERFGMYIGITYDEVTRIHMSDVKYVENLYPFVDDKITRRQNVSMVREQDVFPEKSGCVGCIYNSKGAWTQLLKENRLEYLRWEMLEQHGTRYPEIGLMKETTMESFRVADEEQVEMDFVEGIPQCEVYGGCFT
jgi:hypothetical protein